MSLRSRIRDWDGRSRQDIERIFRTGSSVPGFLEQLLRLVPEPEVQVGATWLLKRGVETTLIQPAQIAVSVLSDLESVVAPEAKLHVFQLLHLFSIPASTKRAVEAFVRDGLGSGNGFVRAWALSGFHALADQYPEHRLEVLALMEDGLRDGPPATKARIRRLKSVGFKAITR